MKDSISPFNYTDGFAINSDIPSRLVRDSNSILTPLVSIMIPTYRRPDLLREAVKSALTQITTVPFEVVVVDNDNEEEMAEEVDKVISSFDAANLRHFRNQTNVGLYGNWNRCIELARGCWITILNDDDLLDQSFLEEALELLKGNSSIKLVGCTARVLDIQNNILPVTFLARVKKFIKQLSTLARNNNPRKLGIENYFLGNLHHGSLGVLMERKAAIEVGGFNQNYYPVSDYLFLLRFIILNPVYYLPKVLATYRVAVNVSTRPEVCAAGVHYELQIREALISYLNMKPNILRYFSRLVAIRAVSVFRRRWCPSLDIHEILKREGLVYRPILAEYLITGLFLRIFLTEKKYVSD
jgi:glycosyltransferase involved in cell wall biosynthesis